jgi:hypothetical protein
VHEAPLEGGSAGQSGVLHASKDGHDHLPFAQTHELAQNAYCVHSIGPELLHVSPS